VWGNDHGRALPVGTPGLVVTRLMLDHPALPLLEKRLANFQLSQCALTVCIDDSMSVSFENLSLSHQVIKAQLWSPA